MNTGIKYKKKKYIYKLDRGKRYLTDKALKKKKKMKTEMLCSVCRQVFNYTHTSAGNHERGEFVTNLPIFLSLKLPSSNNLNLQT